MHLKMHNHWQNKIFLIGSLLLLGHVLVTGGRFWFVRLVYQETLEQLWPYGWNLSLNGTQQFLWLLLVPAVFFSWLQMWYWREYAKNQAKSYVVVGH